MDVLTIVGCGIKGLGGIGWVWGLDRNWGAGTEDSAILATAPALVKSAGGSLALVMRGRKRRKGWAAPAFCC